MKQTSLQQRSEKQTRRMNHVRNDRDRAGLRILVDPCAKQQALAAQCLTSAQKLTSSQIGLLPHDTEQAIY